MVLKKYNYVNKNRMIQILIVPLVDRSCGNYVNQNELLILKKKIYVKSICIQISIKKIN
jgi:hypothetical protein